jgi:hypothetical protein
MEKAVLSSRAGQNTSRVTRRRAGSARKKPRVLDVARAGRFAPAILAALIALPGCSDSGDPNAGSSDEISAGHFTPGEAAVTVYSFGAPKNGVDISAGYQLAATESYCTKEIAGDCTIYECTESDPGGQPVMTGRVSATVDDRSVSIDPISSGVYAEPKNAAPELFHGGETVVFEVEPSVNVPYQTGSVVAPYPVILTSPDPYAPIQIDRTKDLELKWVGGKNGDVTFVAAVQRADGSIVSETCSFPATDGGAIIPAATIGRLPANKGLASMSYLFVISRTEIDAEGWHPAFSAVTEVLNLDGEGITPDIVVR